MPSLSDLLVGFLDGSAGHLALAIYLLAVTDEQAIEVSVLAANWKIPAMQTGEKACQKPHCHAHRTQTAHMIRTMKELM